MLETAVSMPGKDVSMPGTEVRHARNSREHARNSSERARFAVNMPATGKSTYGKAVSLPEQQ